MAINKNSTGYTFTFAILMVVVVGTVLAFTAMSLKDRQAANAADKKMMDILGASPCAGTDSLAFRRRALPS